MALQLNQSVLRSVANRAEQWTAETANSGRQRLRLKSIKGNQTACERVAWRSHVGLIELLGATLWPLIAAACPPSGSHQEKPATKE